MSIFGGTSECELQEAFDIPEAEGVLGGSCCDLMIDVLQHPCVEGFELVRQG